MAGYDLRMQREEQADLGVEGDREQYNSAIPAPVGPGGNTTLRNGSEDDIVANSYELTPIRPNDMNANTVIACDDSHLQGVYRSTMGDGY